MDNDIEKFNRFLANWIINDFTGLCKKHKTTIEKCGITPAET
jgi:Asp-tRNA(Asn)/Glu-tRNA(Gln) amidotransferase B subunit